MKQRVVITGIGPVTAIGIGVDEFFQRILDLQTAIRPLPAAYEKKYHFKSRFYVPFPEFQLSDFGIQTPFARIMEKNSTIALLATHLALQDAGISDVTDACVVVGIGIGSLYSSFRSHVAHTVDNAVDRYNRMIIPLQMPNAISAWISINHRVKGENYTLNAACASGTMAIGEAYRKIADGRCRLALAGGVECLEDPTGSTMRGFDSLNALTKSADGLPRPFCAGRSGFLYSDGAGCMLLLESLEHAQQRGARIYAEIAGYASNSDAHHILQVDPTGAQIRALMRQLLQDKKVDYINAHGTGTTENDRTEAEAMQAIFGPKARQPLINATKGLLGHSLGASGALEAAVTALAVKTGKIHGNSLIDAIPDLNLTTASCEAEIDCAASFSYGFGGHNAGLLFQRCRDNG